MDTEATVPKVQGRPSLGEGMMRGPIGLILDTTVRDQHPADNSTEGKMAVEATVKRMHESEV
jgi:hypothetical protein